MITNLPCTITASAKLSFELDCRAEEITQEGDTTGSGENVGGHLSAERDDKITAKAKPRAGAQLF